ncbi:MAG: type II secretory pathway component GspD/PulD (secretin) [Myxococcota bacterium]|jgi:type II secretory pathway component GspD/PulD (secretin)
MNETTGLRHNMLHSGIVGIFVLASAMLALPTQAAAATPYPAKTQAPIKRAKMCRTLPEAAPVRLGFRDAPVIDVAQFFACISGRLIVAEIDLNRFSLDLHAPRPVPLVEARRLWLQALRKVGLDLFERDGVWVIERLFV